MMNKKLLPAFCLALSIFMISCGKEDDSLPAADTPTPSPALTTEQNKSNLQATGVDFVKNMNDLKSMPSLDVSKTFSTLLSKSDPFGSNKTEDAMAPIRALLALNQFKESGDINVVYASMKTSTTNSDETPQAAFDSIRGTYSWNASTSIWTKTPGTSVVLQFPSTEFGTTNNASYTLTYKGYTGATPFTNYSGDLPEAITGNLKVDGAEIITFAFNALYNTDGIPSSTTIALNVNPYHFLISLTTTNSLVGYNYSIKRNATTLINYGINATGNFSKANLQSINDSSLTKIEDVTKIATAVSAHFQVLDLIVKGNLNVQGLANSLNAVGGSENATSQQSITAINSNYQLGLSYVSTGVSIAQTEFYLATHTDSWQEWVYDPAINDYVPVTHTSESESVDVRFVFADASKSDFNTYFNTGFDQIQTDWNALVTDLENKYK